jgi:hypothetical protein
MSMFPKWIAKALKNKRMEELHRRRAALMRKVGEIDDQIIAEFGKTDPNRPKK